MSSSGYQRIVVCIADDDASQGAVAAGRRLLAPGGVLMGVHVLSHSDLALVGSPTMVVPPNWETTEHASALLHRMLDEDAGEEPVLLSGDDTARALCTWAADDGHPDLIVVAAVRGSVRRTFQGAVAGYLAYHAPCQVLVVHPDDPAAA